MGGLRLEDSNYKLVWQRLFEAGLFRMKLPNPLYWVVGALDESESSEALVSLLNSVSQSQTAIHILILSRKTELSSNAFDRLSTSMSIATICKTGFQSNMEDIRVYVESETKHMRGNDRSKKDVIREIIDRADGNFLWARLVSEREYSSVIRRKPFKRLLVSRPRT